jgi:hypothetical protein
MRGPRPSSQNNAPKSPALRRKPAGEILSRVILIRTVGCFADFDVHGQVHRKLNRLFVGIDSIPMV